MKTETREIYKCEYCNKLYQIKRFAEYHELRCIKNPNNYRKCLDECIHLTKKMTTAYVDHPEDDEWRVNLMFCKKKETFLYPPKVEIDNKQFDLGDGNNNPMPKECKVYDKYSDSINMDW